MRGFDMEAVVADEAREGERAASPASISAKASRDLPVPAGAPDQHGARTDQNR